MQTVIKICGRHRTIAREGRERIVSAFSFTFICVATGHFIGQKRVLYNVDLQETVAQIFALIRLPLVATKIFSRTNYGVALN